MGASSSTVQVVFSWGVPIVDSASISSYQMSFFTDANDEERIEDVRSAAKPNHVTAPPSGFLSVHVKSLKLDENHFVVPDPDVYIRVRVGSVTKATKVVAPLKGRDTTVINDVKNFSLAVSADRSLPQNEVRIDLIMVVSAHVHRILGHKDMHIYDIIKNLYAAGKYDLRFRHEHVAFVDMEMCFAYGIFGYGYSHQLENRQAKTDDIVSHSFLYRAEPPAERRQQNGLVMAPVHIDHPDFINFREKAQIGSASYQDHESGNWNPDPFERLRQVKPDLLTKKMSKRLDKIRSDYAQLGNRSQRKKFLEKLILRKAEDQHTETGVEDIPGEGPAQPGGPMKGPGGKGPPPPGTGDFMTVTQAEDEYEEGEMNVIDMASIIANAPGIIGRGTSTSRRQRPNLPDVIYEDGSIGSQSSSDEADGPVEIGPISDARGKTAAHSLAAKRASSIFQGLTSRLRNRWRESRPSVDVALDERRDEEDVQ